MTTEDAALILLRYESGARGSVAISQVSAGRKNSLQWEIDGADVGGLVGLGDAGPPLSSAIAAAPTRSCSAARSS